MTNTNKNIYFEQQGNEFIEMASKHILDLQIANKVVEKLSDKVESVIKHIKQECKKRNIVGQDLEYKLTEGITIYEQKSKVIARSDLIKDIETCENKLADAQRRLAEFDENGFVENTRTPTITFKISKEEKMVIDAQSGLILTELMKKSPAINNIANRRITN
jgi:hypothetical protein